MPIVNRQKPGAVAKAPVAGVLSRIAPIGFDRAEGIKVLLYGGSGTGKTTIWATFPGPILVIVCSGGFRPGELRSINTPENKGRIDQVVLHSASDMKEIIDYASNTTKYKTIVLDHVSGLCDLALAGILGIEELPAQKSFGMAAREHYGQLALEVKEYLKAMLNFMCNVVIIGQERIFGGKEDGVISDVIRPTIGAAVTPSIASWLNPACDYVIQTFKRPLMITRMVETIKGQPATPILERGKGVEYCARCEAHDIYFTKFRVPKGYVLPDVLVNPTYAKIMSIIERKPLGGASGSKPK